MITNIILEVKEDNIKNSFRADLEKPINSINDYLFGFPNFFKCVDNVINILKCPRILNLNNSILDLTIKLKPQQHAFLEKPIIYSVYIEYDVIAFEILYYDGKLVIKRDYNELIPEIGPGWEYMSKEDPRIMFQKNQTILNQPALSTIYEEVCNIFYLDYEYLYSNGENWKKVLNENKTVKKEFQRLIPLLGFDDIKKVTDDLEFIGNKNIITIPIELRGTGFNKLIRLLPMMIYSFTKDSTLLISNFTGSLHPILFKNLIKYYQSNSTIYNQGRILTYDKIN